MIKVNIATLILLFCELKCWMLTLYSAPILEPYAQ